MEVITDPAVVGGRDGGTAVTIGAYDGVHLGHQAVLREVRRLAAERGLPTVVLTFDRHPATVVRPESAPKLLTDLDQKIEALAATGDVDYAVVLAFDRQRAAQEAESFAADLLAEALAARLVVVGEDFHFGRGRRGNVALLRRRGAELGFEVAGLPLVEVPGADGPVSSTAVRRRVAQGDVAGAAALLGRPYEVRGVVSTGERRGRELGYPTANLAVPPEILLPADGVYAGWYVRPGGGTHPAAIGVGRRPTFGDATPASLVEANLLDFDGDLYGEAARVRFTTRLRDDERFESPEALVAQMGRDVAAARDALLAGGFAAPGGAPSPPSSERRGPRPAAGRVPPTTG